MRDNVDKFLKLKQLKKNELESVNLLMDSSKLELYKSEISISKIEEMLSNLAKEKQKNVELIKKIVEFSKFKKDTKIATIFVFIFQVLIITFPVIIMTVPVFVTLITIILTVALDIAGGFIIRKDFKEKEIKNYTIDNLEQINNEIEKQEVILNNEKTNVEKKIFEINNRLKQYYSRLISIQETINFIENIRNESIERLCCKILDEQFEIVKDNTSFQKVLKDNNRENNR